MQTTAKVKFIRMSPKKVRLVVDVIRNMKVDEALEQLRLMKKIATKPVSKLLNSAIANAENNFELSRDNLYIKEIRVDEGPTLKRWMPRAHGRATTIRKRSSHIVVTLAEIKDSGEKKGKKPEVEAPVKLGSSSAKATEDKGDVTDKKAKEEMKEFAPVSTVDKGKEKDNVFDEETKDASQEVAQEIKDPRREGRGGHARVEGGRKGFASRIFRRKSG